MVTQKGNWHCKFTREDTLRREFVSVEDPLILVAVILSSQCHLDWSRYGKATYFEGKIINVI